MQDIFNINDKHITCLDVTGSAAVELTKSSHFKVTRCCSYYWRRRLMPTYMSLHTDKIHISPLAALE